LTVFVWKLRDGSIGSSTHFALSSYAIQAAPTFRDFLTVTAKLFSLHANSSPELAADRPKVSLRAWSRLLGRICIVATEKSKNEETKNNENQLVAIDEARLWRVTIRLCLRRG
jgi:hypothetical protein